VFISENCFGIKVLDFFFSFFYSECPAIIFAEKLTFLFAFFVILAHKKISMRLFFGSFLFLFVFPVFSQENENTENVPNAKIDSLYREDQFYFSFTINTLQNKPVGLRQDKLSSGISAGFLRDFPLNKKRNVAIAPGLGFTFNNFNQNLAITELDNNPVYTLIDSDTEYRKNRFSQFLVDVPIEFRWRTSTYENHKFWRIYGGVKLSYLIYDNSVYEDAQGKIVVANNKDFDKFQYGTYISAGYNTINVYAYYGLNSLFKSAKTNTEPINMNTMNIGIIFYIL
jgi:Outer membrane protein beta-barrel domain